MKNLHLNNQQVGYSVIQAVYMLVIASITAGIAYLSDQIDGRGFLIAFLTGLSTALFRVYSGWQDGMRQVEGEVLARDVHPSPIDNAVK